MQEVHFDLDSAEEVRAKEIHDAAIVIDGTIPVDVYLTDDDYRYNLHDGGITAVNFTVESIADFRKSVETLQRYWTYVERDEGKIVILDTEDIERAKRDGKVGVILGFQNAQPIQFNLEFIRAFHQMGTRVMQLTYNSQNHLGGGCWERNDCGLSHFGLDAIDEMNERGIVVDLSHCGDATTLEAIEYSSKPVVISHASIRALSHVHGRGKTDEHIKALAENGGVIGVTFFPALVKHDPDTHEALETTAHDVLDQIDHVVDLVGVDHVGFGSDMSDKHFAEDLPTSGGYGERHDRLLAEHPEVFSSSDSSEYVPPHGLERHTMLLNLTRGLVGRGYTDTEIEKILGGNFLRVFDEVWN